jgi:hypothetical protein
MTNVSYLKKIKKFVSAVPQLDLFSAPHNVGGGIAGSIPPPLY